MSNCPGFNYPSAGVGEKVDLASDEVEGILPVEHGGSGTSAGISRAIWGYQDFTAGTISGTSVTLTANENGSSAPFSAGNIIGSSASIFRQDGQSYAYTGTTKLFSSKVTVSSHSGASITLSGIPNSTWGTLRIWYQISSTSIPTGYTNPPLTVQSQVVAELGEVFVPDTDIGVAVQAYKAALNSLPANTILGRITSGTGDVEQLSSANVRTILGLSTSDSPTFAGLNLSGLTASQLLATDGSKNLQSLTTATYPSLTEISYVKGVTSAIQTQLNAKQALNARLTAITGLTNGSIVAIDASGNIVSDTVFTYDSTNKRLAVGGTAQTYAITAVGVVNDQDGLALVANKRPETRFYTNVASPTARGFLGIDKDGGSYYGATSANSLVLSSLGSDVFIASNNALAARFNTSQNLQLYGGQRVEGGSSSLGAPGGAGSGLESYFSSGLQIGYIRAYNRDSSVHRELDIDGNPLNLNSSGYAINCGGAITAPSLTLSTTPLAATSGGNGYASYAVGDLLYASTTTALSKLAGVAAGNALISGGVSTAPSWGKIDIAAHVSGLASGIATFLGTPSSANLAAAITNETGSGALVFGTSPVFTTKININATTNKNLWVEDAGGAFTSASGMVVRSMTDSQAAYAPLYFVGSTVTIGTNTNVAIATFVGSTGFTGIGTTGPEATLHVSSSSVQGQIIGLSGSNQQMLLGVSSGRAEIQAILQGSGTNILRLNSGGGDVEIGGSSGSNLNIMVAGRTLKIKQGTNACAGTGATMSAGVVTVNTNAVATGDIILTSKTAAGGTLGSGDPVVTISNGTSFTLTSSSVLETSTFSWWIVKAA